MDNLHALPNPSAARAPHVHVRRWGRFPDLLHFAVEYLLLLPVGAAVALVWANAGPESYFRIVFDLDFFVTDVAMVLFFGLVTKEIVEATGRGGVLHPWRRAALPVVAAIALRSLGAATAGIDTDPHVNVYMALDATDEDVKRVEQALRSNEESASVRFVPRDQALAELRRTTHLA